MKSSALTLALLAVCLGASVDVQAQPAAGPGPQVSERVFVSINGLYQVGSNDFEDSATIRENAENGRLETDYSVGTGPAFDLSAGVLMGRTLAVGVGVTRFSTSTTTALSASVPHPFFFNQPRAVEGQFDGERTEVAVHVQLRILLPLSDRVQVMLFGGPSFFRVEQSIVSDFEYTESYPYDTATFSRAIAETQSESKVGLNAGADVSYFFSRQIGVGFTAQYAGTTVEMEVPSGTADVRAGGGQFGGGLRLRF